MCLFVEITAADVSHSFFATCPGHETRRECAMDYPDEQGLTRRLTRIRHFVPIISMDPQVGNFTKGDRSRIQFVRADAGWSHRSLPSRRHEALQLFEPVEHDIDLRSEE